MEYVVSKGVRTSTLQLSAMREGDYTYQLTVTDSAGHQSTAEVTVIVQPGKLQWEIFVLQAHCYGYLCERREDKEEITGLAVDCG